MAANWKYDELQRQIEKEQIRKEIIAEEIARRRILEEEVRRELMMEKKIAFRTFEPSTMSFGCSYRISPFLAHEQSIIPCKVAQFHESRTGSSLASPVRREIGFQGSENLPFLLHPDPASAAGPSLFSNGIQPLLQPSKGTTVLARLETNVSGQKRKSPIPEADQDWNNQNSTKKPKGWNCSLCNVVATSQIDLNLHKQGRKHKAKEAGVIVQERSYGATSVATECNSINGKPNTALLSTSDMGVKNTWKAGRESSESVYRDAAEAGKRNNIRNMNIISYSRSTEKAREVDLCSNGDMPIKAMPSAKSSEKSTLGYDLCQVGSPSALPVYRVIGFQGSENLPFQPPPNPVSAAGPSLFSNGIQPLLQPVLARLETNASGQKRKSPIPEADQEWNNQNSTKKPKGWNCFLCNVIATSEIDLNLHKQGRKHKAKEASQERSYGAAAVATECNSSNGKPSTVLLSTHDMGMKNAWKAGGESLESVLREAAAANEAGKKHLARLHKDISAKGRSCSSESLSKSRDAEGINGGDALPKVTAKEIAQNRLESTFIPFEMKEMLNANEVVSSRDNGSCVVVGVERDANIAMVSTCDTGVKMTFKADVKSSKNVVGQAAAEKHSSIEKLKGKTDPTKNPKAKDVDSNCNGGTSGPQTMLLSAKSQEKIMFSSEICRVVAASTSSPTKPLSIEKVAEGIKVGNALPKETKETEKEVMQVEQENVIPSEVEESAKNIIDGISATCKSGLDEHKPGRNEKAKEAALVVQKTVTPSPEEPVVTLGIKKVIIAKQGRYASAAGKGDATRSRKKASGQPCEQLKLWYQMSQVGTSSVEGLHDDKLYDEGAVLPDVTWFVEEVAQEVIDEDVLLKGANEAGKEAMQDELEIVCVSSV